MSKDDDGRVTIYSRIRAELYERLEAECDRDERSRAAVVERALDAYLPALPKRARS
jgi:predicted DNA-binding protein